VVGVIAVGGAFSSRSFCDLHNPEATYPKTDADGVIAC
jgi:hypothetical protein